MINAKQDKESDPLKRRDSITILIEGEEDHTVIDNPPGFPTKEELKLMGVGGETLNAELEESENVDPET